MSDHHAPIKCGCTHKFQDSRYGPGLRVVTPINKALAKPGAAHWRCTVCRREHQ